MLLHRCINLMVEKILDALGSLFIKERGRFKPSSRISGLIQRGKRFGIEKSHLKSRLDFVNLPGILADECKIFPIERQLTKQTFSLF